MRNESYKLEESGVAPVATTSKSPGFFGVRTTPGPTVSEFDSIEFTRSGLAYDTSSGGPLESDTWGDIARNRAVEK